MVSLVGPVNLSVDRKEIERVKKDTWLNIEERDWFVVHVPPARMASRSVCLRLVAP